MTALDYFKKCFSKSFSFEGRASRSEYWYFVLISLGILFCLIFGGIFIMETVNKVSGGMLIGAGAIFIIILIPAGISVKIRRLHDIGYNGWWFFIQFIPFIGGIWSLVLSILESQPFPNKYGPNPHGKIKNEDLKKFCSQCGAAIEKTEGKFCYHCGVKLIETKEGIKKEEETKEKWV